MRNRVSGHPVGYTHATRNRVDWCAWQLDGFTMKKFLIYLRRNMCPEELWIIDVLEPERQRLG